MKLPSLLILTVICSSTSALAADLKAVGSGATIAVKSLSMTDDSFKSAFSSLPKITAHMRIKPSSTDASRCGAIIDTEWNEYAALVDSCRNGPSYPAGSPGTFGYLAAYNQWCDGSEVGCLAKVQAKQNQWCQGTAVTGTTPTSYAAGNTAYNDAVAKASTCNTKTTACAAQKTSNIDPREKDRADSQAAGVTEVTTIRRLVTDLAAARVRLKAQQDKYKDALSHKTCSQSIYDANKCSTTPAWVQPIATFSGTQVGSCPTAAQVALPPVMVE